MKKSLIIVVLICSLISVSSVAAEDTFLEDCSLAIMLDGYHFVEDVWDENYTTVSEFKIYQNFNLRLYLENTLNHSIEVYLPTFDNPDILRFSNQTFKPYEFTTFSFIADILGDFIIECPEIAQPIFTVSVVTYEYVHFYEQPLMITLVSFPIMIILGLFGQISESIKESKKKNNSEKKIKRKIKKGDYPVYSSPIVEESKNISDVYHRFKQIRNTPVSDEDILEAYEKTVTGFKYAVTNPELLVKVTKENFPKDAVVIIKSAEDLPNEFAEAVKAGESASVSVALQHKQLIATNRSLLSMVGRLHSQLRLVESEKANLKHERDVLDRGLVEADGSIITDSIPEAEHKQQSFWKKYKGLIISSVVGIGIVGILIMVAIFIINNTPAIGG